mgnify:CR=1 FL=1
MVVFIINFTYKRVYLSHLFLNIVGSGRGYLLQNQLLKIYLAVIHDLKYKYRLKFFSIRGMQLE